MGSKFVCRNDLNTCCLSDSASPWGQSAMAPPSHQWAGWVHSRSCWCADASGRDSPHQKEAVAGPLTHCCPLSLWSPGNSSNVWRRYKMAREECITSVNHRVDRVKQRCTCSECRPAPSRPTDWELGPSPACPPECRRWRSRSASPGAPPETDDSSQRSPR